MLAFSRGNRMNYDNATLANVFSITTIALSVVCLGLTVLWVRTREELLKARRDLEIRAHPNERLTAIEETLEDLSLQVERVGEVDRFAARLLAERLPASGSVGNAAVPSGTRQITPH